MADEMWPDNAPDGMPPPPGTTERGIIYSQPESGMSEPYNKSSSKSQKKRVRKPYTTQGQIPGECPHEFVQSDGDDDWIEKSLQPDQGPSEGYTVPKAIRPFDPILVQKSNSAITSERDWALIHSRPTPKRIEAADSHTRINITQAVDVNAAFIYRYYSHHAARFVISRLNSNLTVNEARPLTDPEWEYMLDQDFKVKSEERLSWHTVGDIHMALPGYVDPNESMSDGPDTSATNLEDVAECLGCSVEMLRFARGTVQASAPDNMICWPTPWLILLGLNQRDLTEIPQALLGYDLYLCLHFASRIRLGHETWSEKSLIAALIKGWRFTPKAVAALVRLMRGMPGYRADSLDLDDTCAWIGKIVVGATAAVGPSADIPMRSIEDTDSQSSEALDAAAMQFNATNLPDYNPLLAHIRPLDVRSWQRQAKRFNIKFAMIASDPVNPIVGKARRLPRAPTQTAIGSRFQASNRYRTRCAPVDIEDASAASFTADERLVGIGLRRNENIAWGQDNGFTWGDEHLKLPGDTKEPETPPRLVTLANAEKPKDTTADMVQTRRQPGDAAAHGGKGTPPGPPPQRKQLGGPLDAPHTTQKSSPVGADTRKEAAAKYEKRLQALVSQYVSLSPDPEVAVTGQEKLDSDEDGPDHDDPQPTGQLLDPEDGDSMPGGPSSRDKSEDEQSGPNKNDENKDDDSQGEEEDNSTLDASQVWKVTPMVYDLFHGRTGWDSLPPDNSYLSCRQVGELLDLYFKDVIPKKYLIGNHALTFTSKVVVRPERVPMGEPYTRVHYIKGKPTRLVGIVKGQYILMGGAGPAQLGKAHHATEDVVNGWYTQKAKRCWQTQTSHKQWADSLGEKDGEKIREHAANPLGFDTALRLSIKTVHHGTAIHVGRITKDQLRDIRKAATEAGCKGAAFMVRCIDHAKESYDATPPAQVQLLAGDPKRQFTKNMPALDYTVRNTNDCTFHSVQAFDEWLAGLPHGAYDNMENFVASWPYLKPKVLVDRPVSPPPSSAPQLLGAPHSANQNEDQMPQPILPPVPSAENRPMPKFQTNDTNARGMEVVMYSACHAIAESNRHLHQAIEAAVAAARQVRETERLQGSLLATTGALLGHEGALPFSITYSAPQQREHQDLHDRLLEFVGATNLPQYPSPLNDLIHGQIAHLRHQNQGYMKIVMPDDGYLAGLETLRRHSDVVHSTEPKVPAAKPNARDDLDSNTNPHQNDGDDAPAPAKEPRRSGRQRAKPKPHETPAKKQRKPRASKSKPATTLLTEVKATPKKRKRRGAMSSPAGEGGSNKKKNKNSSPDPVFVSDDEL